MGGGDERSQETSDGVWMCEPFQELSKSTEGCSDVQAASLSVSG